MFYGSNVQDTRQMFYSSWYKYTHGETLSALEQQIAAVIQDHPEYQGLLSSQYQSLDQTYFPELGETNPFLHMGLHLAIREQIATDRPAGIKQIFNNLLIKHSDPLLIEHKIMESLMEVLWQAQRNNHPPDETVYLNLLQKL